MWASTTRDCQDLIGYSTLCILAMASNEDDSSDGERSIDLFREPDNFYAAEKPATFTEYKCKSGAVIKLRLVGHSPLWVH